MSDKMNWPLKIERQEMKMVAGSFIVNGTDAPSSLIGDANLYTAAYIATGQLRVTMTQAYKGTPIVLVTLQNLDGTPTARVAIAGAYNSTNKTLDIWTLDGALAAADPSAENVRISFALLFQDYVYGE